jgi:predicted DNA-binding transcriptional regulator AlpA
MPKPPPLHTYVERPIMLRPELLATVPYSMSTVDRLEARGEFPKRVRLEPTNRVGWVRREVKKHLRRFTKRRPGQSDRATTEDEA